MGSSGGGLSAERAGDPIGAGTHAMSALAGETALIHAVCPWMIHRTLSEVELARGFATVEALRAREGLRRFLGWVGQRPPGWRGRVR